MASSRCKVRDLISKCMDSGASLGSYNSGTQILRLPWDTLDPLLKRSVMENRGTPSRFYQG